MLIHYNDITLSSIPTQTNKQQIFIKINPILKSKINSNLTEILTQNKQSQNQQQQKSQNHSEKLNFKLNDDDYIQAYVDPSQLSYNSFQNILNLDQKLKLPKITIQNLQNKGKYYKFTLKDQNNLLMKIHQMNLYTLPFNNLSRGGKRMIFSSINLSGNLTKEINQCQNKQICNKFNSVNQVFRLNSFSPTDQKFYSHYDTPYADDKRKLYSRYTMIIYLTGGTNPNNPCLKIDDQEIKQIPPMTGIIFDQKYEHQGNPYIQNDKIFIRTQLIYHIRHIQKDPNIAYFFNKACYFTKQSIYHGELQKYSSDLFNHTAKLRYSLQSFVEDKYLIKKSYNVLYITNGNKFWFKDSYDLKILAKLVLVDYFNGRFIQKQSKNISSSFNPDEKDKKIFLKQYKLLDHDNQTIISYLNDLVFEDEIVDEYPYNFENIVPPQSNQVVRAQEGVCGLEYDGLIRNSQSDYQQSYKISTDKIAQKLDDMSVALFNNRLYINENNIKTDEISKKIKFNEAFSNQTINFASCNCQPIYAYRFIEKESNNQLQGFYLPDIDYQVIDGGYVLKIDMFRNGFIHKSKIKFSVPNVIDPQYETILEENMYYDECGDYIDSDEEKIHDSQEDEDEDQQEKY